MKFDIRTDENGFEIIIQNLDNRTRFVSWSAMGHKEVYGQFDLSFLEGNKSLYFDIGFEPTDVKITPIPDPTPGVHQAFISQIPSGSAVLSFKAESAIPGRIDVMVSPTGHPNDSRSCGMIPRASAGSILKMPILTKSSWKSMFIKKMENFEQEVALSNFEIEIVSSKQRFYTLNHLIKPEHKSLLKNGLSQIVFSQDAPLYSYFTMGFQKK